MSKARKKYMYAVTAGSYDDYRVLGVCRTRAEAKKISEHMGGGIRWESIPLLEEMPTKLTITVMHLREVFPDHVRFKGDRHEEREEWEYQEWDIDPMARASDVDHVPAHAEWNKGANYLSARGLDPIAVREIFEQAYDDLMGMSWADTPRSRKWTV